MMTVGTYFFLYLTIKELTSASEESWPEDRNSLLAQKRSSISSANSSGHQDQRFPENADGYIAGQQFSFLFFILLDIRSWMKKKMKGKIVSDVTIPTSVLTVLSFLFFSSFKREKEENGKKTVNWRGIQSSLSLTARHPQSFLAAANMLIRERKEMAAANKKRWVMTWA